MFIIWIVEGKKGSRETSTVVRFRIEVVEGLGYLLKVEAAGLTD